MHFTKTMFQKRNFKKQVDIFRQQAYLECKLLQNRNSQTNNLHFEETVTFLKHLYPIHILYTVFAVYGFLSKEERYSS